MSFGWTGRAVINRLRQGVWAEGPSTGSHLVFSKPGSAPIVISRLGGDIPPATLRSICRGAGWNYPLQR
jgi:predicted RNA binding protein YcfA (HicA-like mRNA interferase family)